MVFKSHKSLTAYNDSTKRCGKVYDKLQRNLLLTPRDKVSPRSARDRTLERTDHEYTVDLFVCLISIGDEICHVVRWYEYGAMDDIWKSPKIIVVHFLLRY